MLSAYDIKYVLRNAMKVQAVADFIAALTPPLETSELPIKECKVWADGACEAGGSRIEILLQIYTGIKFHYVATLVFNATNNVAEYKAAIMALRFIAEISIQKSIILVTRN